jgi:uncharacterized membrane protein (GlpM family)
MAPNEADMRMVGPLLVRVILGGVIVSAFSVIGELFKPKTFAGLFGAAPSVALVSLALAASEHGKGAVAAQARSMVIGGCALLVYCTACLAGTARTRWPVWLSAALSWGVWATVAFAIWFAGKEANVLQ